MDDIAVIGVGVRFPGEANSPENLWQVLENGESQWSEIPKDRLNIDGFFHPSGDRQGSISFRGGHFLKDDFAAFDAPFFSIAAEDAKAIDPQQRMLLEVAYEAIENAGLRKEDIAGSDTAVYVGSFVKDYEQICLRDPDWQPQYAATGNGIAIMANRISYFFDLHGPSVTVDTGCSGSLVSVHWGVQSIRNGESSLAIVAGAGLILTPATIMPMTALNFLSPDGRCFTFDSRANGYGRGEGIGVVVLKRLSEAIKDNDPIRAVIRGSKVNQDGRTTGITLPSKEAQVANIRSVYKSAGLDFDQTAYVECHGTGTQAGDWRELKAISETLGSTRSVDNPVVVGSVKPNIGHLEGAAGVAGLIKGVMVLEHGKIPPNINFKQGNPDIHFEDWRVKVPQKMLDWPLPGLKRVSINCFGFGGTNAHVIMDEAPAQSRIRVCQESAPQPSSHVFLFSAQERQGVKRITESHLPYLRSHLDDPLFFQDYAYTLACRRSNFEWRQAFVAGSVSELVSLLEASDPAKATRASKDRYPRICFVFCGQGAQWATMGQEMLVFDVFRDSLTAASNHLQSVAGSDFDLLAEIMLPGSETHIQSPAISQPATTAIQVALVDLLQSIGISCQQVVGHSSGEIAAAYASGAIKRTDAWELAFYRGLAAASIPIQAPELKGTMAAVGLSEQETRQYLKLSGHTAHIACINSPKSVTISGLRTDIEQIVADMQCQQIFCKLLKVGTAYHSPHMMLVSKAYQDSIGHVEPGEMRHGVEMFSSVSGRMVQAKDLRASYWTENLVSPVQFVKAMEGVLTLPEEQRPNVILELSPAAVLRSPINEILSTLTPRVECSYYSTMDRKTPGESKMSLLVGDLWCRGLQVKMPELLSRGVSEARFTCVKDLPPYPWNHEKSYWHESHLCTAIRFRQYGRHDLIGAPTFDSTTFEPRWRGFLRISENPWIQDHQVQKTVIYPAAGMVCMVLEAMSQMSDAEENVLGYEISEMAIEKAMLVGNTAHGLEFQLNVRRDPSSATASQALAEFHDFSIYSKELDKPWERHAFGKLRIRFKTLKHEQIVQQHLNLYESASKACTKSLLPRQLYELLDTMGMNYGPLFQNVIELRQSEDKGCISTVRVPDTKSKMPAKYEYPHVIHPATLDAMFHTLFALEPVPMVPTRINNFFISADITGGQGGTFSGYSTAGRVGLRDARADITMHQTGNPDSMVVIDGLGLTSLSAPGQDEVGFLPNYKNLATELVWKEDATFARPSQLVEQIELLAHKYPQLAILQVGGGQNLCKAILKAIAPRPDTPHVVRWTVASFEQDETWDEARALFRDTAIEPFLETKQIDGSDALAEYHVIVCVGDLTVDPDNLSKHLLPGGVLLKPTSLQVNGTSNGVQSSLEHTDDGKVTCQEFAITKKPLEVKISSRPSILILHARNASEEVSQLMSSLQAILITHESCPYVSFITPELILDAVDMLSDKIVISLMDFSGSDRSVYDWQKEDFDQFHAVQKHAKGLIWLTRAALMESFNPRGAPVVGLLRTLLSEDPTKTIVTLDLHRHTSLQDRALPQNILDVFNHCFLTSPGSNPPEPEFAVREGKIYIPRLDTIPSLNDLVESNGTYSKAIPKPFHEDSDSSAVLQLDILKPGLQPGHLCFSQAKPSPLAATEVEITLEDAELTYTDAQTAMGQTICSHIGNSVSGRVKQLGNAVNSLQVGDQVTALVSDGSIKNVVTADASLVQPMQLPGGSAVWTGAFYALGHMSSVRENTKVLVRAGASMAGMVALKMAKALGAEIYTTISDGQNDDQRKLLVDHGIDAEHILDPRTDDLAVKIKGLTCGRALDIIYDPTEEDCMESNVNCVRKCGTIIKTASQAVKAQATCVSNASVNIVYFDLPALLEFDVQLVADVHKGAAQFYLDHKSSFEALDSLITRYPIDRVEDALHHVLEEPLLGQVVVNATGDSAHVQVMHNPIKPLKEAINPDGTYLLSGGLGGLGRSIAELLISEGARHVAFISRSGCSSPSSTAFIESLQTQGVDARVFKADICDHQMLTDLVTGDLASTMPPVCGVFQCAAVIRDGMFDNMTFEDWDAAIKPKTVGSWNLVECLSNTPENPFFVFLASSAGIVGNRGQANYAAGNAFLDSLARMCRLQGQHAVSIDLGPVLGAGMLAEDPELLDILKASGFYGVRYDDFLLMIKHAITKEILPGIDMPPQITLGVGTGGIMAQNNPADPYWSRTALYRYLSLMDMPPPDLELSGNAMTRDMKTLLAASTSVQGATEIITIGLMNMLAKAMNMLPEEIDVGKAPNSYGVDSLVAAGIRNWIFSNCGVSISVFEVLSDDTIAEMARTIARKGGFGEERNGEQ